MKIKILGFTILSIITLFFFVFCSFSNAQTSPGPLKQPTPGQYDYLGDINPAPFSVVTAGRGVGDNVCSMQRNATLKDIIMNFIIGCLLTRAAYLIITLAVVVFVYGIFKFIRSEGDDKQAGRDLMFWGVVGIFVMVSFWGFVAILQSTFNF